MTPADFRRLTLESANEDGQVRPPALTDWWAQQSLLMGMYMEGLIEKRGTGPMWHRGGPWFVARKAGGSGSEEA